MEPLSVLSAFPLSLAVAFLLGFGARLISLPPLVGFLVAGFALSALGIQADETIQRIADLGVTLLLFTIGLKLKLKSLARPEVWATASLHAALTTVGFGVIFYGFTVGGLVLFAELDLATAALLAFALSFSSTVFAVKVLEDKGEMSSLHGRTAIGILIMQDVVAVLFLTASTGKIPSVWAFALVGLVFLRPVFRFFLDRTGHGELLPLFGLFAALDFGVTLFEMVGLKPDLGALILGMLMADHKRAKEVADALFSFKELFLVGFFLNIGLSGIPTLSDIGIALLLVLLLPLKVVLFFALLTRFRLRVRSAALTSFALANYSEFGLIVGAIGVSNGWISPQWLTIIAIALSISFVAAAPLNRAAHSLCARLQDRLTRFETASRHPEEQPFRVGASSVVIFGMGRVGTGAYDHIREIYGDIIVGIDSDAEKVATHRQQGRTVQQADATDPNFWQRAERSASVRIVLLAMPMHRANMYALEQIIAAGFDGYVAALAHYPDQAQRLMDAGATAAFNLYEGAGAGFADHVEEKFNELGITARANIPQP